ncbi:MAG: hypothetical protein R3D67_17645 [Hyphomicrobiaceae bacterium]
MGHASKLLLAIAVAVSGVSLAGEVAAEQKRTARPAAKSKATDTGGDSQLRTKVEQPGN